MSKLAAMPLWVLLLLLPLPAWAAHLPPGREADVKALVWGPELAELGLEVRSVAIQQAEILVVVAGSASGALHLAEPAALPGPFARTTSFAVSWTSAQAGGPPPPVQTWVGRIAARDKGNWWVGEAPRAENTSAPPSRQVPPLAWSVLLYGALWLLAAVAVIAAYTSFSLPIALSAGLAALLAGLAQWLLRRDDVPHALRDAVAGRPSSPLATLAAVGRWHLHLPETRIDLALCALAGLLLGPAAVVASQRLASWRRVPIWLAIAVACVLVVPGVVALGPTHLLTGTLVATCLAWPWRPAQRPALALLAILTCCQFA